MKIDDTNCEILNLLQENSRMSLTQIAKRTNLSVDSVKKRIDKMQKSGYFFPRIQIRPRSFGFPFISDVKIKFSKYDRKTYDRFVKYVMEHPRVAEAIAISGAWDFTLVIIAKDHEDLANVAAEIRTKFAEMISDWSESLSTIVYKFERYDMHKVVGSMER